MTSPENYNNRELSWLAFNQRVLDRALDNSTLLLERVKFLAITASNLDEFFRVRVGGLKIVEAAAPNKSDISGMTATEQLNAIRKRVRKMNADQSECLLNDIEPALTKNNILHMTPAELNPAQRKHLKKFFEDEILSAASPIAISDIKEFPLLAGARLAVCVRLDGGEESALRPKVAAEQAGEPSTDNPAVPKCDVHSHDRFVLIPLGQSLPRFVSVPCDDCYRYMLLEEIIGMFVAEMFPRQDAHEWAPFRILRNADITVDEDARADLLTGMEEMLAKRTFGRCVRLELASSASPAMKEFLQHSVDVEDEDTYLLDGPLGLTDYFALAGLSGHKKHKDKPWLPQDSPDFPLNRDMFEIISEADRVLYHPYQSYDPVVNFLNQAADDDQVIAIKQTLYRTSRDSQIVQALERAAQNGKNVTVILELKARFDEARNILWAKRLEQAGVDVIYGVRGFKTHAKICIVVRREPTGMKRYIHLATGNYNESTSRLYSDVSLFTCDRQLGTDAVHFFNAITGLSVPQDLEKLVGAPINLRETLTELIQIEVDNAKSMGSGEIIAKINSLVDKDIIDSLYAASQSGVKVLLNVRGICCLRPGVPGLSENIRVISVVDRFLEHARMLYFRHGGDERLFISSADWMGRNLDRRVELMVPVEDRKCKERLLKILGTYFEDNQHANELQADGSYVPVTCGNKPPFRSQEFLYREACDIIESSQNSRATVFQPHRGESA